MGIFGRQPKYTQADVASLVAKMSSDGAKRPDGLIEVTRGELAALNSAEYQRLSFGKLD